MSVDNYDEAITRLAGELLAIRAVLTSLLEVQPLEQQQTMLTDLHHRVHAACATLTADPALQEAFQNSVTSFLNQLETQARRPS